MGVDDLITLATAATRDAADGPEFLDKITQGLSLNVRQLTAEDEARLSAYGVIAGIPDAMGLMGDLGGGSLEVAQISGQVLGKTATLPLGVLRFAAIEPSSWSDYADERLEQLDWLSGMGGCTFYTVGGAWRAIARAHITQSNHPLHTIQHYELSASILAEFCQALETLHAQNTALAGMVSARRAASLPAAARVLERLLRHTGAERVVFSAFGLREGFHYDRLRPEARAIDPLLAGSADFARRESRFDTDRSRLDSWLAPLFDHDGPGRRRLRRAACDLVDIAWHEHRDDRATEAFHRVLRLQLVGIDHRARTALALVMYHRYGGAVAERLEAVRALIDDDTRQWANRLGLALRLAMTHCGGRFDLLTGTRLCEREKAIELELSGAASVLDGEVVRRRLAALAAQWGKDASVTLV